MSLMFNPKKITQLQLSQFFGKTPTDSKIIDLHNTSNRNQMLEN